MQNILTTRQLAEAIGVSESSVKRWIDDGQIRATRTAGGHRRVTLRDAARYIRRHGLSVERPERLGLPELAAYARRRDLAADTTDALYEFLTASAAPEAAGLLASRLLAGASVAELVDGPLVGAMARVGELWRRTRAGIFSEHRATETAVQALTRLRALLTPPVDAPVALGGAPAGDPYILPTLAAAAVLEDEGLRAVNLGPETPIDTLAAGVKTLDARLVWTSVSVCTEPDRLRRDLSRLADVLAPHGGILVVGGAQAGRADLRSRQSLYVGNSMAELRAIAQGLQARL